MSRIDEIRKQVMEDRGVMVARKVVTDLLAEGTAHDVAIAAAAKSLGLDPALVGERLNETADFDYGIENPQTKRKAASIEPHDFVSKSSVGLRQIPGNYADNPLEDQSLSEGENDVISRFKAILTKAGVTEEKMRKGVKLTRLGAQKVAAQLGISADDVMVLLATLSDKSVHENDDRFGMEKDFLDNVTVRDSETGKGVFLRGSKAASVLQKMKASPEDEQSILAAVSPQISESDEDEVNYDGEMASNHGTYNFPWTLNGRHGTGTAHFKASKGNLTVKVIHVRDAAGKGIKPDQAMREAIEKIALDFIGHE